MKMTYQFKNSFSGDKITFYMLVLVEGARKWRNVGTITDTTEGAVAHANTIVAEGMWQGNAVVAINQRTNKCIWRKLGEPKVIG